MEDRKVLVDCHEPEHIDERIKSELGLPVVRQSLEAGDYCVGNILIERKEINDYWNTLNAGRLFDQLYNMSKTGKRCILVVIGVYPKKFAISKVPYKVATARLKNMVRIVFIAYGVLMEVVDSESAFIKYVGDCWKRSTGGSIAPVARKEETPLAIKRAILCCVPGIGGKLGDFLATKYTIPELLKMSVEELSAIEYNGRKIGVRGAKIKEVFGY